MTKYYKYTFDRYIKEGERWTAKPQTLTAKITDGTEARAYHKPTAAVIIFDDIKRIQYGYKIASVKRSDVIEISKQEYKTLNG